MNQTHMKCLLPKSYFFVLFFYFLQPSLIIFNKGANNSDQHCTVIIKIDGTPGKYDQNWLYKK